MHEEPQFKKATETRVMEDAESVHRNLHMLPSPFQGHRAALFESSAGSSAVQNHLSCGNLFVTLDSVVFPELFRRSGDENPFLEICQGCALPTSHGRAEHFQFRIKPAV